MGGAIGGVLPGVCGKKNPSPAELFYIIAAYSIKF